MSMKVSFIVASRIKFVAFDFVGLSIFYWGEKLVFAMYHVHPEVCILINCKEVIMKNTKIYVE